MIRYKRAAALLMALLVMSVVLLSSAAMVIEADHNCTGADCPVCRIVTALHHIVRTTVSAMILLFIFTAVNALILSGSASTDNKRADTPVSEKVRLLN